MQQSRHAQLLDGALEGELLLAGVTAHGAAQRALPLRIGQNIEAGYGAATDRPAHPRPSRRESRRRATDEHGLRTRGDERIRTGDDVQTAPDGVRAHGVQKFFCQTASVVEQVHARAVRGDGVGKKISPSRRDGAQKQAVAPAGLRILGRRAEFARADAFGAPARGLAILGEDQPRRRARIERGGRRQVLLCAQAEHRAVGVQGADARRIERLRAAKRAEVEIFTARAEERGLDGVRCRAVKEASVLLREIHAVERGRVARAVQPDDREPGGAPRVADAAQECGLAAARPALEDTEIALRRPKELPVQRVVARAGHGAEKVACFQCVVHGETSHFHGCYSVCSRRSR
ncbi:MAG: hypothetical protein ACLUNO_03845 [Oscillospiraceae bacterium]